MRNNKGDKMKTLIKLLAIMLIMGCTASTSTDYGGIPDDWYPTDTICYIHGRLKTEAVFSRQLADDMIEVRKLQDGYDTLSYYEGLQQPKVEVNIYDLWPREMCQ